MSKTFIRLLSNPPGGMVPSHMTPPEAFTTADKTELIHSAFETDDESILVGVWEAAPSRE